MSVNRLPDEILQIILQHVLLDPDPRLICTTLSPAQWDYTLMFQFIAPRDVVRARSLLQVSKRWNPIVLQFLYACVIISKVHHASDVITRVKSEPVLGRRIKSLWMHAGNLQLWTDIVSHTHKITLVYLNIDALEGSEEIARAFLTSLNPETVYLHWTQRRGQPWISSVLLACVRMFWTNMVCGLLLPPDVPMRA
ncbi:uncharacterized protein PHACADRAFT_265253 [Phanerochaete carnosa HHB-10118-sp]|uniref:F-box domain-containing protein n=1 Tax=Phanerochaete carnosa (strain HHB-10118-sp) TaxID=650164 RepID=K5VSX9_PHACS|nr:uncharacterized protein PHACADRAFT_265253 [Phanerochaete carnosa HHB-10118-sp]EKM49684.1 hypothetical protein PHACADRAFT_265253 [Phanerochaete carnosa HHB-10118-sp]